MNIAINRTQWSRSSQRSNSSNYDERADFYENIAYRCRRCFAACVFTAESQRDAYEIRKKFVAWVPSLCEQCQSGLNTALEQDRTFQAQWNENRANLKFNSQFLQAWLAVVKEIVAFGKGNPGMVTMLTRQINELAPSQYHDPAA